MVEITWTMNDEVRPKSVCVCAANGHNRNVKHHVMDSIDQ